MLLDHPVLPFLVAAAVLPLVPRRIGAAVMLAAPVAALAQLLTLDRDATAVLRYFGFELHILRLDDLSWPFALVFVVAAFLAGLFGISSMATRERVAALLYAGSGLGVVLAGDLLTLFVMWEVKAVVSAVLIALAGRAASRAAAFRYLVVHVIGGSLLLGGVAWHLAAGGAITFDRFGSHASGAVVLVAFLLAAAVPPLHSWLPDAYPEASVAGTVFLSAFTTKAAVYALLRGFAGTEALVAIGVAMALYGVVYAVLENDLRRLLGYHIVSQVGFMVTAVGVGTAAAINGATAHAFAHILYKALLLMAAGSVLFATGRSKLTDLGGLARAMPLVMLLYVVGAVSISGVPLFSGFVSKELVVDAARADGRDLVVNLLKLASVGTFLSVGLKLPWFAFGGPKREIQCRPLPATMLVAMGVLAAANLVLGLRPGLLYDLLPFAVDYQPYEADKLIEVVQLLTFTTIAFALLTKKLKTEPTITLDTDWLYRTAPRWATHAADTGGALLERGRTTAGARLRRLVPDPADSGATPPVVPTALLGNVLLGAFLLVLALSLFA